MRRAIAALLAAALVAPSIVDSVPGAAATTARVYLPNVTKTLGGPGGWTTPIVVQNAGGANTTISVALYRFVDGSFVTTLQSPRLLPGQGWYFDLAQIRTVPDDTQFAAVVTAASGEVAAMVVEGSSSNWMAYSGVAGGARTLYLPNITRRLGGIGGWDTPFIVQNLGGAATTAAVSFYDLPTGALVLRVPDFRLDPGRSRSFSPWVMDGLSDDRQYAVVVEGGVGAELYAIVNEHQAQQAMSYEGLSGGAETVYLPRIVKYVGGTAGWSSPFVVQNLGPSSATFALEFYDGSGRLASATRGLVLAPGRSHANDVRFSPAGLLAGEYSVVVRGAAGSRLGAIVNQHELGAARAMSYGGLTEVRPLVYVPHVQKRRGDGQFTTTLFVQNAGLASAHVEVDVHDLGDGMLRSRSTFAAVAPGAAARVELPDRLVATLAFSALVKSTEPVAVVANHVGTIAGDVAMSVTGIPSVPASTAGVDLSRTGIAGRLLWSGQGAAGVGLRVVDLREPGDGRASRIYGSATTGADGRYTVVGIPAGTDYLIEIPEQPGWSGAGFAGDLPLVANQIVEAGERSVVRTMSLTPADGTVLPAGPVTFRWDPVPGAGVYCLSLFDQETGALVSGPPVPLCGGTMYGTPQDLETSGTTYVSPPLVRGHTYWFYLSAWPRTAFEVGNNELGTASRMISVR